MIPNKWQGEPLHRLRSEYRKARQAYYYNGEREVLMTDEEFDLMAKTYKLKAETERSMVDLEILKEVGAPVPGDNNLVTRRHMIPMGSLSNVCNETDAMEWIRWAVKYPMPLHASFKMDGASVSLTYVKGELRQAITRGDGVEGEDVTSNMVCVPNIPLNLPAELDCYVRGEIVLPIKQWKAIDPEGESNPRNLGNGIMRRKSGQDATRLAFYGFRMFDKNGRPWSDSVTAMYQYMVSLGFAVAPFFAATTPAEIQTLLEYYRDFDGRTGIRDQQEFEIDGLVIQPDSIASQIALGPDVGGCPAGQAAWKFAPRRALSKLLDVEWNLGSTGALIPVAVFEPVTIGGVSVSRASLGSAAEVIRLELAIGDTVVVTRRADVIPKVECVESKVPGGRKVITPPEKCPHTGGPVGRIKNVDGTESAHLYSLTAGGSAASMLAKLSRFLRETGIEGMGDVYVKALFESRMATGERWVEQPQDFFRLRGRGFQGLLNKDGTILIGRGVAEKIMDEIDRKRDMTLTEFLGVLGVPQLGKGRVKQVRLAMPGEFDKLEDWFGDKLEKNAVAVGLPKVASKVQQGLNEMRETAADYIKAGVRIVQEAVTTLAAGTPVFCLTGDFPGGKDPWHRTISSVGWAHEDSFNKRVTHVVSCTPESASTGKAKKAREKGIPVISETELARMIEARNSELKPK